MNNLDFLKNVELDVIAPKLAKTRTSTPKLPETADLRVFPNGKVYPSQAFADKFALEFQPKVADAEDPTKLLIVGNGLDIFSSLDWGMIAGKIPQELVFCAAVPKSAHKVDMWGSTKYDDKNEPKASVFTQGTNTFAKTVLLEMITKVYGIDFTKVAYVDLTVAIETPVVSSNAIYHIPKKVSTGKFKGEDTYVRRENLNIYPLMITHIEDKDGVAPVLDGNVEAFNENEAVDENQTDLVESIEEVQAEVKTEEVDKSAEGEADWAKGLGTAIDTAK